jgi:DNA-binding response OmpR family regulator
VTTLGFPHTWTPIAAGRYGISLATTAARPYGKGDDVTTELRKPAVLLVVEDDRDMRSLLCDELWDEGFQLREAANGDEALIAVMEAVPDLIITDLKMPAGGVDYVNRLRTFAPDCPIILMTAFGDGKTKDEVVKSGATAYFAKPVHLSDLKATIRRLLDHKHE